jgi:hypothetical protein
MAVLKVTHPVLDYQWIEDYDFDPAIHKLIEDAPIKEISTAEEEAPASESEIKKTASKSK